MLPFYIDTDTPSPRLFELSDGRFQLLDQTPPGPFMAGPGYLVVEPALADFLQTLALGRVSYEPAILFDRTSGQEYRSHVRIRVGQFFRHDQIRDLDLDGCRLLTMNDAFYFVSPALKTQLEQHGFAYLRFSEGLSGFAGV